MTQEALVKNAADSRQVKFATKKERIRRERDIEDTRAILAQAWGRRYVWRYLEGCGIFRSSWSEGNAIYFNEGRRDIGLNMMADIMAADPNAFILMMNEARTEELKIEEAKSKEEKQDA